MKLLFVGTNPEPGGAATHFVALTTALLDAGHTVGVVAHPTGAIWRALAHDARVQLHAGVFRQKLDRTAMSAVQHAARAMGAEWIVGAFEADYWGTALVAAACRIPVALFLHHAGLKDSSLRVLPRLVTRFLVPSNYLREWIVARGIDERRVAVVKNPIDTSHFRRDTARREVERRALGVSPDDVLVSFIGRIEANKGVDMFAHAVTNAMSREPSLRALWVGFGRLEQEVDRIINASPYASRHIRRPWTDDPWPCYTATDMLALPSTGPEAFGRVSVEAQACGVPVLGSAIGGIAETMDVGASGLLVTPVDADAWADAVCALVRDHDRRLDMGVAGPRFVRREFDRPVIARSFVHALERATPRPAYRRVVTNQSTSVPSISGRTRVSLRAP